jgi:hypothetical protein
MSFIVSKPKFVATSLLIAVFVAGVAVGSAASAWADRNTEETSNDKPSYVDRLQADLDLSAEQRAGVEHALERYNDALHVFWNDVQIQKDSVGRITRAEIMGLLNEVQQAEYADINARIDSMRAERRRQHDKDYEATKQQ